MEMLKNVYTERFGKRLAGDDLLITEQCLNTTGKNLPPTHIGGKTNTIDTCFVAEGTKCMTAGMLPKYEGLGNQWCSILDFSSESILGTSMPKIVRASARKLNCATERIRYGYSKVLNQLCDQHRIFSKLVKLEKELR